MLTRILALPIFNFLARKKSSMMLVGFYPKSDQTFLNDFVPVCITGCPNQWSNSQSFQKMRPLCSMMFLGGI